jgi:hypothetical protein
MNYNYQIIKLSEAKIGDKLLLIQRSLDDRWLEYNVGRAQVNINNVSLITEAELIGLNVYDHKNYYQFGINDPNNIRDCFLVTSKNINENPKASLFKYWRTTTRDDWYVGLLKIKNELMLPAALTLLGLATLSSLFQKKIKCEVSI